MKYKYLFCFCFLAFIMQACSDKIKPAPDFKLMYFDGRIATLNKMRGKVFLLNFWATYCLPCVEEIPNLNQLFKKYHDKGFTILGVAMDDDLYQAKYFMENQTVNFPVVARSYHIEQDYGVSCMPMTYLISKDGMILKIYKGKPDFADLEARIQKALNQ